MMAEDLIVKVSTIKEISGTKINNLTTEAHKIMVVSMKGEKHRSWTSMAQTQIHSLGGRL